MSSATPVNTFELSTNHHATSNTKVIIENHSDDITISKCDQLSPPRPLTLGSNIVPVKSQVLPLVYIQNKNQISYGTNTFNRPTSNNFLSQIQFTSAPVQKTVTSGSIQNGQNFILTPARTQSMVSSGSIQNGQNIILTPARTQPLVLPKPPSIATIVGPTGAKLTGAYVTMLKPIPKPDFTGPTITTNQASVLPENMIVSKNGFLQSVNMQPQKIVLQSMHKILPRGPSVTATTNSVQPKFTVVPMPLPNKRDPDSSNKPIFNFQISDGKLQRTDGPTKSIIINNTNRQWTKLDPSALQQTSIPTIDITEDKAEEKSDVSNKVYELSITEESISNQSHTKAEVTSGENSNSSSIDGKKESAKSSHGVSILKKNFGFPEKNYQKETIDISNCKEVITIPDTDENIEDEVITIPQVPIVPGPKPERRRKPQFSYRKDDSDISFVDATVKKEEIKQEETEIKQESYDFMEVEQIRGLFDVENDDEIKKMLRWEGEIGTLPETNLKFIYNEFGILEYLTDEDYRKIQEKRHKKILEKIKFDPDKEVRCLECGCYGLQSDFTTLDYCSLACQDVAIEKKNNPPPESKIPKKRKRKVILTKNKSDIDLFFEPKREELSERSDHDDEKSNDSNSKEKFNYPWACKKKGFSWAKYLDHMKVKGAPVKLFKDPFPYNKNGFRPGMKLEGIDPQHPSYFCVMTVVETVGYRMRLHFDSYSENYDIWCNADSMDIFPVGWCEKYDHVLQPPRGYTLEEEDFSWVQYLKETKCIAAPKHLFANRAGQAICPNGFRIGMKLEAVDKKNNTSLICVATVRDMMDNRILVHFDGWDDIYDYWADPSSPYIHPVGWCDQYGHNLTAPSDYPTPETFSWETYLKEKKATAAPVRAFKQRPTCGFKRGMRLECVDKRVLHLIRVATVDDVKEHQIRIHFDGWPDRYSYWVDDDSPDIHPVGWCQKTGHPIEPPLTPDDVYDFLECPTVGCRGQGHIKGPKYSTHNSRRNCPYADENIDTDRFLPDRLLSPNRNPEAIVPVSREPKPIKPRIGRPPKPKPESSKDEESSPEKRLKNKRKYTKRKQLLRSESESEYDTSQETESSKGKKPKTEIKIEDVKEEDEKELTLEETLAQDLIEQEKICPAERESWREHSQFLDAYILSDDNPFRWKVNEVIDFVSLIPGCENRHRIFKQENIDGEAFLHLSQKDIIAFLKLKVGPAVKLYNSIVLLREKFKNKKRK